MGVVYRLGTSWTGAVQDVRSPDPAAYVAAAGLHPCGARHASAGAAAGVVVGFRRDREGSAVEVAANCPVIVAPHIAQEVDDAISIEIEKVVADEAAVERATRDGTASVGVVAPEPLAVERAVFHCTGTG